MQPTLQCAMPETGCHASDPDRLLVEPYSTAPRRGDIAIVQTPKAAQLRVPR